MSLLVEWLLLMWHEYFTGALTVGGNRRETPSRAAVTGQARARWGEVRVRVCKALGNKAVWGMGKALGKA